MRSLHNSFIRHSGLDPESGKDLIKLDSGFRRNDKIAGFIQLCKGLVVCLSAVLFSVLWSAAGAAENTLRIGGTLPSIVLQDIKGGTIRIPDGVRGKVVVLHFWQAGCSSCKLEMPAMESLYGKYQKKGLEVLAVNVGQQKDAVKRYAAGMNLSYPILIDTERKIAAILGVTDVPRTYMIDRKGIIRYRIFGGATPEMLRKLIVSLL